MFVKLGQVMSTRTDLISPQAAAELGLLQDHVRPAPRDGIAEVLEDELDAPVSEVFRGFDWKPVAAASIGQVYRAQLPDGSLVVVKVQRPGIDESVRVDLSVLEELGNVVESRTSWGREYRVSDLIEEFSARLREELDYELEARHMALYGLIFDGDPLIRVPQYRKELSTRRLLTMEWLEGNYPDLVPRYDQMYGRSSYASKRDRGALAKTVGGIIDSLGGLKPRVAASRRTPWRSRASTEKNRLESEQLKLI